VARRVCVPSCVQTFLTIGLGDYSVSWSGDELRALLEVATFVACTCARHRPLRPILTVERRITAPTPACACAV
jgi:hypothetical protein